MTGYLELLTDPSYAGQGIVMTYPIIGSYGIFEADAEASRPWAEAFIIRENNRIASNFRNEKSLNDYLIETIFLGSRYRHPGAFQNTQGKRNNDRHGNQRRNARNAGCLKGDKSV
jgi:hypothetical protein